jgi:ribose transport system ATP-binding protein
MTQTNPVMEMISISKNYSGVPALTEVSLSIKPGEVHALLGENGAGKSTLMNVATGTVAPSSGYMVIHGQRHNFLTPRLAAELGIAIVHQHPAVLPDLTVLENLQVALPKRIFAGKKAEAVGKELLEAVGLNIDLKDRLEKLSVAQKHLVEIAKALAVNPKILVLDEPTAPLGQDSVELLFELVRRAVAQGTSVVYITHRLAEVREVADQVTVLRDGLTMATLQVGEVTDSELLALIIGRELKSTFPPKVSGEDAEVILQATDLSGIGFENVSLTAKRGQIIGIAGIVGNGQSNLLRALAGQDDAEGEISIANKVYSRSKLLSASALMPSDRQHEGLMMRMSVRENASVAALKKFRRGPILSKSVEHKQVLDTLNSISVKAQSTEVLVSSLSGGNQQKIVLSRALLSEPKIVLADEPTQGVDVGARSEIYQILRQVSADGIPVVVSSSDSKELEGLCDVVYVMSRGQIVEVLEGEDITEERMVEAAISSTTQAVRLERIERASSLSTNSRVKKFRRFLQGDYAPSILLLTVMGVLGSYILSINEKYLSDFNISSILLLATALGFIALGQTTAMMTGGIDLSAGPLAGLLVVVASFFFLNESPATSMVFGVLAMLSVALAVGLFNGTLIRYLKFTAIAATLTTYIALGGFAFLLRSTPDGYINSELTKLIATKFGPIPAAFIVLVVAAFAMEYVLRRRPWGLRLRAVGSEEESARRVGVKTNRMFLSAYIVSALFTMAGAVMLMAQLGLGDPAQGVGYTLTSITAVVLGGTSLLGGRGTYLGTLLGSILLIQVLNSIIFLGLDQMWQYIFQASLILVAAILYGVARQRRRG